MSKPMQSGAANKTTKDKVTARAASKTKKAGRPKRKFSEEQKAKIEQMALDNCHLDTIAKVIDVRKQTLVNNFGTFISKKKAEGRARLRFYQVSMSEKSPAMAIFLGKNELEQTDKQEQIHDITGDLAKFLETLKGGSSQCPSERDDQG